MKSKLVKTVAIVGVGVVGYLLASVTHDAVQDPMRQADTQMVSSLTTAADSPQKLATEFENGFRAGDLQALKNLVWWVGADEFIRGSVEGSLKDDLQHEFLDVQVEPSAPAEVLEFQRDGKTYRPNLPVEGKLKVNYRIKGLSDPASSTYLIGKHGEQYYIGVAATTSDH